MKKSTGLWIALAALASGAAIGTICNAGYKRCSTHGKCGCGHEGCDHETSHHEVKDELIAQMEKLKDKLSSLL
jgi:hypothetical protein